MKLKELITKMNGHGIPIPLLRLNGTASFTGTLALISFTTALLGQIGKITHLLGPIDLSEANTLFMMCLSAHLGHKLVGVFGNNTVKEEEHGEKINE